MRHERETREMTKSFLLGLITGATTIWVLKDSIATGIDARTHTIRARAAHGLHVVAEAIEGGVAGKPPADPPTRIARVS
jgi:hypothetical protein